MQQPATVSDPNSASADSAGVRPRQRHFGGFRALVVGDVETTRQALVGQLVTMGFDTDTADDAFGGFAKLDRAAHTGRKFDVVVLDRIMAGMSGGALAARVRRTDGMTETNLVMTNGGKGFHTVGRCAPVDGVLDESIYRRPLLDCLREVFMSPANISRLLPPAAARSLRVLIVEDNAINQRLATAILGRDDHVVELASDGAEAVAAVAREAFDVILMDIQMPVMDGIEATKRIRSLSGSMRHVPIIALTAHTEPGARQRYLSAGMNDFIAKPLAPLVLLAKIQEWAPLKGARPLDVAGKPECDDVLRSVSQSLGPFRNRALAFVN